MPSDKAAGVAAQDGVLSKNPSKDFWGVFSGSWHL
jgi:hypothetical protein